MVYISHEQARLYNIEPPGLENPFYALGRQANQAVCALWSAYPARFLDIPGSAFRWFFNSICSVPPVNQPPIYPAPPFLGGQCSIEYYITASFLNANTWQGGACGQLRTADSRSRAIKYIRGPIQSIGFSFNPSFNAILLQATATDSQGIISYLPIGAFGTGNLIFPLSSCKDKGGSNPSWAYQGQISNIQVIPRTGQDTCGDPPPVYPEPPTPPPVINYNFELNDGDDTYIFPFEYTPTFEIPIIFKNTDFNIIIDFGGTTFEWKSPPADEPNRPKSPIPTLPPPAAPPNAPPPGGGGRNPRPRSPGVERRTPVPVPPDGVLEEEEAEGEEIVWVMIDVSGIWDNSKYIIEYANPQNDVLFAGYLCWTVRDQEKYSLAPEIPIRRRRTILRKPPECEGYILRADNGASMQVTTFIQKVL